MPFPGSSGSLPQGNQTSPLSTSVQAVCREFLAFQLPKVTICFAAQSQGQQRQQVIQSTYSLSENKPG